MPVVPEDSELDGPLHSPSTQRELLTRFSSAARREVRRAALYAAQPSARSESDTTVASTERRSLSLVGDPGRGAARLGRSIENSRGSTSVVNSSDFHSAHAGLPEDAGAAATRAPFDVGRGGAPDTDSDTTTTHGGSGWTGSAAGALRSPSEAGRGCPLDSEDSSVCLPAPTLRPGSPHGASTVLISSSSVSSDAANPISTPKKKQR